MLKINNVEVYNLVRAIYSARNPMDSWDRSDSDLEKDILGEKDLALAVKLCNNSSDHRKFTRQILVSVDITAPIYFWKEFDTYKVGTTANSCSTMHTLHKTPITIDLFSVDGSHLEGDSFFTTHFIPYLEQLRTSYLETKDKEVWRTLIQALPMNFNQMRTVTLNYEVLLNMYHSRRNHKLSEWHTLCDAIEQLPYAKELILLEK